MKAVIYSTKDFEKALLEKACEGRHELKFVTAQLCIGTADYAKGYDAVIIFTNDDAAAPVIERLAEMGVKYISTRSVGTDHIDMAAAKKKLIMVNNVPAYSPQAIAELAVGLVLALARKLIPTIDDCRRGDFRVDHHLGFNLYQKTIGIIGLGNIGQAAAAIFHGFGCRVLGYDIQTRDIKDVENVNLDALLVESDIISLHVPFNALTHYMIDKKAIAEMKQGVMLINTSRGGVINTQDVIDALESGQIGFLGLDVYEFEKGLFFEDHQFGDLKDPLFKKLLSFPNVIVTPHQGFLTREAVQGIALQTVYNLDKWDSVLSVMS